MEGKASKGVKGGYRDSVWKYYSDSGFLLRQDTYNAKGKVNTREFIYFTNKRKMSEKYEYFEGDYHDKTKFNFHTIETLYYTNGRALSERHKINGTVVETKCWDPKGNPKPIEYLDSIKSMSADD